MNDRKKLMLNLACGKRAHEDWINIDYSLKLKLENNRWLRPFFSNSIPSDITIHDLRHGIPYEDETVDVVYCSHFLEHLEKKDSLPFMLGIYKVLKPKGIVRIVVPDLEEAVKNYLSELNSMRFNDPYHNDICERYDWATIMLLDQMVRTYPGGEMADWLRKHRESKFVRSMEGTFLEIADSRGKAETPQNLRNRIIEFLKPKNPASSGELHRWMYDEVSLRSLFVQAGFKDVYRMTHLESRIKGWTDYCLDNNSDSSPHQPHSIWMEGIK